RRADEAERAGASRAGSRSSASAVAAGPKATPQECDNAQRDELPQAGVPRVRLRHPSVGDVDRTSRGAPLCRRRGEATALPGDRLAFGRPTLAAPQLDDVDPLDAGGVQLGDQLGDGAGPRRLDRLQRICRDEAAPALGPVALLGELVRALWRETPLGL